MYGERGRLSPALGEGGNGDDRGMAGERRDAVATWGGKERGIAGWGRRMKKTGESCEEVRASKVGIARAGRERERRVTRDGRAGAA